MGKMKRKKLTELLLITGFVFLLTMKVFGQEQGAFKNMPAKYLEPYSFDLPPSPQDETLFDTPWIVYSDRSGNKMYKRENLETIADKLEFGEKLGVMDIDYSKELIRVTKVNNNNKMIGEPGWIDWDNLLLNKRSVVDSIEKIDIKAMIILVLGQSTRDLQIRVYHNPYTRTRDSFIHKGIFRFFYIYKKLRVDGENYYLLGKNRLANQPDDFYGWVSEHRISTWSHRVLWENNWESAPVSQRKDFVGEYGVVIGGSRTQAECINSTNRLVENIDDCIETQDMLVYFERDNNLYNKRKVGVEHRYPILDLTDVSANAVRIGRISNVQSPIGDYSGERIDSLMQKASDLRKVNILFVIDATQSMEDYSPSVRTGVREAMIKIAERIEENVSGQDANKSYSFGAVLYRDADMEALVEKAPGQMTDKWQDISDWIENRLKLENNNPPPDGEPDEDLEEAMFYGINYALDRYPFDPKQSNYLILVGDCGDHLDTTDKVNVLVNTDTLAKKFRDKNINILAFQVANRGDDAYKLFNKQVSEFLYLIIENDDYVYNEATSTIELPPNKPDLIGKLEPRSINTEIDPSDFANSINNSIQLIENDVNEKIAAIEAIMFEGGDPNAQENSRRVYTIMKLLGVTYDQAVQILEEGFTQEYQEGWASLKSDYMDYNYFKQVVLFDEDELSNINTELSNIKGLIDAPPNQKRIALYNILVTFCRKYFGSMQIRQCQNKNINELLKRITGADCKHEFCEYAIGQIQTRVSIKVVDSFIKYIASYQDRLSKIESKVNSYPGRYFLSEKGTNYLYVYIPIDDLP
jgi:hypothetical protein